MAGEGTIEAPQGYAIAEIGVSARERFDGFRILYMKITDDGLDPKEKEVEQVWHGGQPRSEHKISLTGDGRPIVGIYGR